MSAPRRTTLAAAAAAVGGGTSSVNVASWDRFVVSCHTYAETDD